MAGKEGWGQIPGPDSLIDRLNVKKGLPTLEYRQDYSGKPHFSKPENRYIHPHQHNFQYNESNQPIEETVTDIK